MGATCSRNDAANLKANGAMPANMPDIRMQDVSQKVAGPYEEKVLVEDVTGGIMRGKGSNITAKASDELDWSVSDASVMTSSTTPALHNGNMPPLKLTEENLAMFDKVNGYRQGCSNAIKKILFTRLRQDSHRFHDMEPEPVPEEYLKYFPSLATKKHPSDSIEGPSHASVGNGGSSRSPKRVSPRPVRTMPKGGKDSNMEMSGSPNRRILKPVDGSLQQYVL